VADVGLYSTGHQYIHAAESSSSSRVSIVWAEHFAAYSNVQDRCFTAPEFGMLVYGVLEPQCLRLVLICLDVPALLSWSVQVVATWVCAVWCACWSMGTRPSALWMQPLMPTQPCLTCACAS
jgi:hypothetical protein